MTDQEKMRAIEGFCQGLGIEIYDFSAFDEHGATFSIRKGLTHRPAPRCQWPHLPCHVMYGLNEEMKAHGAGK